MLVPMARSVSSWESSAAPLAHSGNLAGAAPRATGPRVARSSRWPGRWLRPRRRRGEQPHQLVELRAAPHDQLMIDEIRAAGCSPASGSSEGGHSADRPKLVPSVKETPGQADKEDQQPVDGEETAPAAATRRSARTATSRPDARACHRRASTGRRAAAGITAERQRATSRPTKTRAPLAGSAAWSGPRRMPAMHAEEHSGDAATRRTPPAVPTTSAAATSGSSRLRRKPQAWERRS